MTPQEALVSIFNEHNIPAYPKSELLAKDFGVEFIAEFGQWRPKKKAVRMISTLGIEAHRALKNFLQTYKKYYRNDKVTAAFYALDDNQIADLFLELPYWMKSYFGNETYMPTAENFLKEKLWYSAYPNKIAGERRRMVDNTATDWDTYLLSIPEHSRDAVEVYRESGVSFAAFKATLNG